jgi:serine/threonine protein kinase/TolB-like protein/Flp pilus assembly protein TadD
MSTIEQLQLIEDLFQAALERPPDQRASFIAQACPNDDLVAAEILALLAAHAQTAGPLDAPPYQFASGPDDSPAADRNLLPPGKVISHYRVIDLLGKGGMGEVYLAEDVKHNRKVALKLLPESLNAPPDHLKRFAREARALLALNHPNIITIYEVGEDSGIQYIVTELVEGQTLRKQFAGSRVDPATALDITIQIAGALSVAHDSGVVHRDIKPENVMLRSDGIVKVLDFGLAKLHKKMTTGSDQSISIPGMIVGTPAYMSPEQACGQETDTRSDIFSLGVILYEMLTGRLPFRGLKLNNIFSAILSAQPESLTIYVDGCPPAVQAVVDRMLAKDPVQRYATAQELLRDLKQARRSLVGGEDPESRPASPEPEPPLAVRDVQPTILTSLVVRSASFGRGILTTGRRLLKLTEPGRPFYAGVVVILLIFVATKYIGTHNSPTMIDSLAVMPFAGSGGESDRLADDLTDGLIDDLSRMADLKVIVRNSVASYKGKQVDPKAVGSTLNVKAIITGKLIRKEDGIYIEAELIDTRDQSLIWSNKYQKKLDELISVPAEIGREIAVRLGKNPGAEESGRAASRQLNPEADALYQKGRINWSKRTKEARDLAIANFQDAIALNPDFDLAYIGLADAYILMGDIAPRESLLQAENVITRALKINPQLAEAHATRGFILAHYHMDWEGADREFKEAIRLKRSYATAHHWYADALLAREKYDEAFIHLKEAQSLDPQSPMIYLDVGLYYFYTQDYKQAAEHFLATIKLFPNFFQARLHLGCVYLQMGRYDDAIEQLRDAQRRAENNTQIMSMLGYAYAVSGRESEAMSVISKLDKLSGYTSAQRYAMIYAGLGRKDEALKRLLQAYDDRDLLIINAKISPFLNGLRSDQRFAELLKLMNLPM